MSDKYTEDIKSTAYAIIVGAALNGYIQGFMGKKEIDPAPAKEAAREMNKLIDKITKHYSKKPREMPKNLIPGNL